MDVKRLLKKLNIRKQIKISEFKFSNDRDYVRHKMLDLITSLDIDAGRIVIRKTAVRPHLQASKSILYNFVIAEYIMRDVLASYDSINHINLHLDLSMSKNSRIKFDEYFAEKVSWRSSLSGINRQIGSKVYHSYSHHDPCLQVADYLAGSLFQLYEHGDGRFYNMIKAKVIHSHGWGEQDTW